MSYYESLRKTITNRLDTTLEMLEDDLDPKVRASLENYCFTNLNQLGKLIEVDRRANGIFNAYLDRYSSYRQREIEKVKRETTANPNP